MASIFIRIVIIYIILLVAMKAMGKREIGELEVSELITSLLISEICSIPIDNPDIPLLNAIIPVIFIVCAEIIITSIKNRSSKLKKAIDGTPSYIINNGKLNQNILRENRISIEELFAGIRQSGVTRIEDVSYCILEQNGKLSVIPKGSANMSHIIISDGEIAKENAENLGFSINKIKSSIGNLNIKDVFLMTVDDKGSVYIIRKEK